MRIKTMEKNAGILGILRNGCLLFACLAFALVVYAPHPGYGQPPPPPYYGPYNGGYYGYGQPYYQPNPYPYGYYYHPYGYAPGVDQLLQGLGNAFRNNYQPYEYNEEWQEHHPYWPHQRWHRGHGHDND